MSDGSTSRLRLPGVLDMAAAEGFLGTMRDLLQSASPAVIDASAVETLTLPCMQIILAALHSHDRIVIEQPSEAFISAFADLGLDWRSRCMTDASEPDDQIADDEATAADAQPAGQDIAPDTQAAVDQDVAPQMQAAAQQGIASESQTRDSEPVDAAIGRAAPEEPVMAKRILTIDDSKTIRDMLLLTLNEAGFEVLQAVDGQDGLDMLDREQRVDVVVTDINMPRMDGYEVIRQMRKNAAYKATPILVLTTESEAAKRNIAREAGATGWMVKPFDPDRLVATINKVAP